MFNILAKGIELDPKNKGKFTDYCKSKGYKGVTCECIKEGMNSGDPTVRKRANFAYNFGFKKNGKKCAGVE